MTLKNINSEIFNLIKTKGSIHYSELYNLIKASQKDIDSARLSLTIDYGLICKGQTLKLTEKGLKHKSFDLYFKSLTSLSKYQKIYLTFFICFGILGISSTFIFSPSNKEFDSLKNDFRQLEYHFDSINEVHKKNKTPKIKLTNDTLQTKSLIDLNSGKDLKNE